MHWQRLALDDRRREQAAALYARSFERVEIDGWTAFVARDDGSAPGQGFILDGVDPRRPVPPALTWMADDAERWVRQRDRLPLAEAEMRVVGDDVTLDGMDPIGVHWTITWPGAGARVEAQRYVIEELGGCLERRRFQQHWPTMPFGAVAAAPDQDLDDYLSRWGLPHFEDYDTRRWPSDVFAWSHCLSDTTRVWIWFDRHLRSACMYADPGDPARILRMLDLPSPPWRTCDDEPSIADAQRETTGAWAVMRQDDAGNVFVVSEGLPEAVARRWVEVYDARGHKQTYWAEERR